MSQISLLVLSTIGMMLVAVGIHDQYFPNKTIPQSLQFENYAFFIIIVGMALIGLTWWRIFSNIRNQD